MTVTVAQTRTNQAPKSAVVVNPSKVDHPDELRRTVNDTLSRVGWPAPRWFETTADDPGLGQTRTAIAEGAEVVFVCGGDGTVMSAVSALVGTEASMAILPAGTGNLLAANLGLSSDLAAGLAVALEGGVRRLDVGTVEGQHFAVMAVEVISNRPQPRQLDGDLVESSDRLIVEVTPQALWLCVPQPAGDPDLAVDADAATREEAGLLNPST